MSDLLNTRITELLGCKYPIIQTAMGWVADPNLVAGTCNAGGFGFLAGATIPPQEMERDILRKQPSAPLTSVRLSSLIFKFLRTRILH